MSFVLSPSRLNGEEGRQFLPVVVKHFARLSKVLLVSRRLCELILIHWHFVYVTEYLALYFFLQNKQEKAILFFFSFQVHISSENEELCQAALQALGFCVFHSHIVSVIPGIESLIL